MGGSDMRELTAGPKPVETFPSESERGDHLARVCSSSHNWMVRTYAVPSVTSCDVVEFARDLWESEFDQFRWHRQSIAVDLVLRLRLPSTVRQRQLDLFGGTSAQIESDGTPIALGAGTCAECGDDLATAQRKVRAEYFEAAERIRTNRPHTVYVVGLGTGYEHEMIEWGETYCPTCEPACSCCGNLTGDDRDYYLCSRCETCQECCECAICESCGEPTESFCRSTYCHNSDSYHCQECCQYLECHSCTTIADPNNDCGHGYCEHCRDYGHCDYCNDDMRESGEFENDSLDVETVATFDPTGTLAVGRRFGVELELSGISIERARNAVRTTGLACGDNYRDSPEWNSKEDGSSGVSAEVVSPPLSGTHGLEQLRVVMLALSANGAEVGEGTGTHVHLDMTGSTGVELALVARFYAHSQLAIDSFMPAGRRNNYYARHLDGSEADAVETADDTATAKERVFQMHERYKTCNLKSFYTHNTIEFRQHRGTLNYRKLSAWIDCIQALVTAALAGERGTDSLPELLPLLSRHGMSESSASYLQERADKFLEMGTP